jgi:hypothetical protein
MNRLGLLISFLLVAASAAGPVCALAADDSAADVIVIERRVAYRRPLVKFYVRWRSDSFSFLFPANGPVLDDPETVDLQPDFDSMFASHANFDKDAVYAALGARDNSTAARRFALGAWRDMLERAWNNGTAEKLAVRGQTIAIVSLAHLEIAELDIGYAIGSPLPIPAQNNTVGYDKRALPTQFSVSDLVSALRDLSATLSCTALDRADLLESFFAALGGKHITLLCGNGEPAIALTSAGVSGAIEIRHDNGRLIVRRGAKNAVVAASCAGTACNLDLLRVAPQLAAGKDLVGADVCAYLGGICNMKADRSVWQILRQNLSYSSSSDKPTCETSDPTLGLVRVYRSPDTFFRRHRLLIALAAAVFATMILLVYLRVPRRPQIVPVERPAQHTDFGHPAPSRVKPA